MKLCRADKVDVFLTSRCLNAVVDCYITCISSRSSITRIKDQNLFQRDINQERKQFEASRDSTTPTKQRYAKVPNLESPKEDKENEKSFEYGKDESETESETETESSTEDESSEEEPAPTSRVTERKNAAMNSVPHKQTVNSKKPESSESETESESEEEQKPAPVTTTSTRTFGRPNVSSTTSTTNSRTILNRTYNTPASTTASRQPPAVGLTKLRSPFIEHDKDKDKKAPVSSISKTEPSKISSRFGEKKDDTTSSRSFPVRTTASSTNTSTTSSTTSSLLRNRIGSASSDKDDTTTTTTSSRRKPKKVTGRAGTAFVGNFANDDDNDEDNESKDKDSDKDTKKVSVDWLNFFQK